jgi:predicted 3-demethylubiquinone-9 3-methyltransferase (glyoxalase superfamily)
MSALQSYPRITPFLWFDSNAEEAVEFYLTVFENSRRLDELRPAGDGSAPKGKPLTIAFELDGQIFTALNGGPMFRFYGSCLLCHSLRFAAAGGSLLVQSLRRG